MSKLSHSRNHKTCCVYGCLQTKRTIPDSPFFSLPTDHERRIQWLKIIGRHDLISRSADLKPKSYFVCSLHFEECSLKLIRHLAPDAVPCRFLPDVIEVSNQAEILQIANSSIDWDDIILNDPETSASMIPKSQPPNKNIQIVPTNSNTLIIPGLQNVFSKNFYKLIEEKLKIPKDGYRYSKEFLFYALNMYILNPQAYCFISETLYLPKEREVRRIKLKLSPKLDNRVLDCLSAKLKSFPEKGKYCTVCIDAMSLKSNLFYDTLNDELVGLQDINGSKIKDCTGVAYAMMLRGILVKWDQPVSYCFLGDLKIVNNYYQLDSWITGVITKLHQIGFEVMAVVSKDSNMNRYAKYIKDISTKKTCFTVNGKKIYYILEFPHLLKSLRNNLLTKDLYYNDEKRTSWEYIELLFSLENGKKHKLAPKLTTSHIKPDNIQKVSLALAADIFSKTVSNAIHTYVDLKMMPEQARPTAQFCLFLNDLFDVMNSRTYKNENIYKCALGTDESQIALVTDAPTVFDSMTCKNIGTRPRIRSTKTITNIQVSLRSIVSLVKDLHDKGHKRILTERLTLEPLDKFMNLLKSMTSKSDNVVKLTPVQFSRNFSKLFLKYILTKSPLSNRPNAFEKFVQDASQLKTDRIDPIPFRVSLVALNGEKDYRITIPDDFPTIYVASYLFYKCENAHKCDKLKEYAKTLPNLAKTKVYNAYNQKAEFYGKLRLLHLPFIQYIETLEKTILQHIQRVLCLELGAGLFDVLTKVPFESPPCSCFPTNYLMRLLIRLRIYATVKDYNEVLKRNKTSLSDYLLNLLPE